MLDLAALGGELAADGRNVRAGHACRADPRDHRRQSGNEDAREQRLARSRHRHPPVSPTSAGPSQAPPAAVRLRLAVVRYKPRSKELVLSARDVFRAATAM